MKIHSGINWKLILFTKLFFAPTGILLANEPPLIVDEPFQDKPQIIEEAQELPDVRPDAETLKGDAVQVINDIEIQGGTVFALEKIAEWVQPIIGQAAERALLLSVINRITTEYSKAGYPLSYASIPAGQNLSSGKITIRIIEGYLARSEIEVDSTQIEKRIGRYVARLMQERPLSRKTFERYTALIEATPGYKFRINVPRPQSASGATTIRVEQVKKERIKTGIALDRSASDPNRLLGSLSVNSLTSYADRLTIAGLLPNDEVDKFYSASYSQFVNDDGLKLELSARHFKSDNNDRFFVTDIPIDFVETKTRDQFSLGLSYPVQLQRKYSWWLGGKIHHLDEQSAFELSTAGASSQINKDLRYSAVEAFSNMQFNTSRSVSQFKLAVRQGVDLGANRNELENAGVTAAGAEALEFTYLTTEVFWRFKFASKWQLQTRLHGHWSDDVLPSAEQARYGNILFARGYPEGQAQGDRGYAGEVELRFIQPVNTAFVRQVEPYLVVDSAHTELLSSGSRASLSSATIGLAVTDNRYYGVSMEYSIPTGDKPIDTNSRSPIFNFRIRWQF